MTQLTGRLNIEGNVKDTKKKIHWVQSSDMFVILYIVLSYILVSTQEIHSISEYH